MGTRKALGGQQRSVRLTVTLNDDESRMLDELSQFNTLDKMSLIRRLIESEHDRSKAEMIKRAVAEERCACDLRGYLKHHPHCPAFRALRA